MTLQTETNSYDAFVSEYITQLFKSVIKNTLLGDITVYLIRSPETSSQIKSSIKQNTWVPPPIVESRLHG